MQVIQKKCFFSPKTKTITKHHFRISGHKINIVYIYLEIYLDELKGTFNLIKSKPS